MMKEKKEETEARSNVSEQICDAVATENSHHVQTKTGRLSTCQHDRIPVILHSNLSIFCFHLSERISSLKAERNNKIKTVNESSFLCLVENQFELHHWNS